MNVDVSSALYPRRFEIFRLEPIGDPPYFDDQEAQQQYLAGRGLSVVSGGRPPSWFIDVSAKNHRFSVNFYAPSGTPTRKVTWERNGDDLLCRRAIDLFYPDGDPKGRVPYIELVTVTQHFSADGVVGVTLASPLGADEFHEMSTQTSGLRAPVPLFGDWGRLLELSAPEELDRFGLAALDAAIAYRDGLLHADAARRITSSPSAASGWRVPAGDRSLMDAVDALVEGAAARSDIPVLTREAARIIPLAVQAAPAAGERDPKEERARMTVLASSIRDAMEYREGQSIVVDLDRRGDDRVAAYARALRRAGATRADWWSYRERYGVVLVWTGDEADGGLALAMHIVPLSWVSERHTKTAADEVDVRWSPSDVGVPDSLG